MTISPLPPRMVSGFSDRVFLSLLILIYTFCSLITLVPSPCYPSRCASVLSAGTIHPSPPRLQHASQRQDAGIWRCPADIGNRFVSGISFELLDLLQQHFPIPLLRFSCRVASRLEKGIDMIFVILAGKRFPCYPPLLLSSNISTGIGCRNLHTILIGRSLSKLTRSAGPRNVNGTVL